ncbi:MAG: hypothetical protein ACYDH9_06610 [Limisphaerales bacterium]
MENTLSVPSPLFNNLPPCPYSREALLNNRVDIRCAHGAELFAAMTAIRKQWDDSYELILVVCEPDTIQPAELIAGMTKMNKMFEARDLVTFFDHPHCTDPRYAITSANGRYVVVGIQRLSNFIRAARPLYQTTYFAHVKKQFPLGKHIKKVA